MSDTLRNSLENAVARVHNAVSDQKDECTLEVGKIVMRNWPMVQQLLAGLDTPAFDPVAHLRIEAQTLTRSAAHTKSRLHRQMLVHAAEMHDAIADALDAQIRAGGIVKAKPNG